MRKFGKFWIQKKKTFTEVSLKWNNSLPPPAEKLDQVAFLTIQIPLPVGIKATIHNIQTFLFDFR